MKTLCRSNLPAPRLRQAGEVEVRDGVRSQRQSSLPSRQAGLVTFCDDRKLQKETFVLKINHFTCFKNFLKPYSGLATWQQRW